MDACVPRPLRQFLADHAVSTAQEMGWGELKNGELILRAETSFDAFITCDQNLKYQQNIHAIEICKAVASIKARFRRTFLVNELRVARVFETSQRW
jgi:hypothetical protein